MWNTNTNEVCDRKNPQTQSFKNPRERLRSGGRVYYTCEEALGGKERVPLAGGERRGGHRATAPLLDLLHSAHRVRRTGHFSLSSAPHRSKKLFAPEVAANIARASLPGIPPSLPPRTRQQARSSHTGCIRAAAPWTWTDRPLLILPAHSMQTVDFTFGHYFFYYHFACF